MKGSCTNHANGFTHLSLDELGDEYDLGLKFEEKECKHFKIDPSTGASESA